MANQVGDYLQSEILNIDAISRGRTVHMEYSPLVYGCQVVVTNPGGLGKPSSVTVPSRVASLGKVIV